MLGNAEILVVLIAGLILFGPEKLPEIARELGEAVAKLREAVEERPVRKKRRRRKAKPAG